MASFDVVNYSLRANKSIQRSLAFEAVRILQDCMDLEKLLYVGLGSIWFTDFQIAHKFLRIKEMISVEGDDIGYRRALFNRPFKTVRVEHGYSYQVLPRLFSDHTLTKRPWFIWLDYDDALDEEKAQDIRRVIEQAPANSIFLVTLPALGRAFGKPVERPDRIRNILGSIVPDDLTKDACDDSLPETLLQLIGDYMASAAATASRPGGFIRGFRMAYRDTTPMITVGGILPAKGAVPAAQAAVSSADWPAVLSEVVQTPPLTFKEAAVFQAQLPKGRPFTRGAVRKLGFDLEESQLRSFERHYRYYPIFAQLFA